MQVTCQFCFLILNNNNILSYYTIYYYYPLGYHYKLAPLLVGFFRKYGIMRVVDSAITEISVFTESTFFQSKISGSPS
ncbi:MAG: hypothetical protein K0S80_392 [Neobacillus sp.]|nr:hypothetical protein [Neobacillus sp.]